MPREKALAYSSNGDMFMLHGETSTDEVAEQELTLSPLPSQADL